MSLYLIAHIGHTTKWCEHVTWWKPDSKGYTICIDKAGEYSEEQARSICENSGLCIAVAKDSAAEVARSHPYYRLSNGNIAPLYDGENHRPVPNSKDAWAHLIARAMPCGKYERPTPIGAKARAIYLPTPQPDTKEQP